jgi:hypothetical protein
VFSAKDCARVQTSLASYVYETQSEVRRRSRHPLRSEIRGRRDTIRRAL